MTTLTAVAAGGNWSSASTWSPAQVPTAADDCIINATMTGTVMIDGTSGSPSLCRSLDCTGCTHTVSILANKVLNIGDASGGSLTLASGMTLGVNDTAVMNFVSTTTGNLVTTAGKNLGSLNFNGAGGGWTLGDNLALHNDCSLTLTKGTLDDGGHNVSVSGTVSSSNSNTRALTMTGTWSLANFPSSLVWDMGTSTGMALNAGSSTISIDGASTDVLFVGGGLSYGTVSCINLANHIFTITGANTFAALTLGNGAFNKSQVQLAASQTITGTFTANGNSLLNRLYITSDTKGVSRMISAGIVSVSNIDMQDITGTGAGSWNISGATGGSGDCGRNSGITFTSSIICYMKTGVSINWSTSNWFTASGGSTPARVPLPQDTARFDANSITAGGVTITLDSAMARISAMDWTGVTNSPTLAFAATLGYFGDITLASGMSVSGTAQSFLDGAGSNITTSGRTWTAETQLNCGPGTWTQLDDLTTSSSLAIVLGTWVISTHTLTLNGNNPNGLSVDGGTLSATTGTVSLTGTGPFLTFGSGVVDMSGGTIHAGSSAMDLLGGTVVVGTFDASGIQFVLSGANVQIGIGGATYSSIDIVSGSLAAIPGHTLTVTGTGISVSSGGGSGGGSWTFC
jgi:hypothetical protein